MSDDDDDGGIACLQVAEQGEQLDALLSELSTYTSAAAAAPGGGDAEWRLRSQVRALEEENNALRSSGSAQERRVAASSSEGEVERELQGALERERALERALLEKETQEQRLRTQLTKLERIQASAQNTALAQEDKLQKAVEAIGAQHNTLDQTRDSLSRQAGDWKNKAELLQHQVTGTRTCTNNFPNFQQRFHRVSAFFVPSANVFAASVDGHRVAAGY